MPYDVLESTGQIDMDRLKKTGRSAYQWDGRPVGFDLCFGGFWAGAEWVDVKNVTRFGEAKNGK